VLRSISVPPAVRRRRVAGLPGLLGPLLAGLLVPVAGCGGHCTATALEVRPIEVNDVRAPLTVTARLTREGRPFPGVTVKLTVNLIGPDNAHAEALYYGKTDADGRASATRPEGARSVPEYRVTGQAAYYQPLNRVDGVQYCWSSANAPITCAGGPCQARADAPGPTTR
jgi:5-hydroxyisourate hydrolase-like protein (transthyretin family)